jgi:hypothetical protein
VEAPADAHLRIHRFRLGSARLIALERNISYQMSEDLRQSGGNAPLEIPIDAPIHLKTAGHLYNLRTGQYLGKTNSALVHIDPWMPTLIGVFEHKIVQNPVAFLDAIDASRPSHSP